MVGSTSLHSESGLATKSMGATSCVQVTFHIIIRAATSECESMSMFACREGAGGQLNLFDDPQRDRGRQIKPSQLLVSVPLGTSESELLWSGGKGEAVVLFSSVGVVTLSLNKRIFHLLLF